MIILYIIGIIVVIILVISNRKKSSALPFKSNLVSSSIDDTNDSSTEDFIEVVKAKHVQEILEEIDKPEPDCQKLKQLKQKIDDLQKQLDETRQENSACSQLTSYDGQDTILQQQAGSTSSQQTIFAQDSSFASSAPDTSPSTNTAFNGLSVALYVGSLLILAGVAGLVFSGAEAFGLMLLILMTAVFYGGGMLLRNNETLRMASYVFVGTGIMILPFIGLLLYAMTKIDPKFIWMIMSLIGTPMYLFATYTMNSKVFSYFAILGFASISCSLASIMGLALAWYFIFIMVMGLIMNGLKLAGISQKLGIMQESIEQTGDCLPLANFVTSLFAIHSLSTLDYVIMLSIVILQLIVGYCRKPEIWREILLRLGLGVWIMLVVYLFEPGQRIMGIALAGVTLAELLFTFFKTAGDFRREDGSAGIEASWMIACMVAFLASGALIGDGEVTPTWTWCSFMLGVDTIIILVARYAFQENVWYLGLLFAGVGLPITIPNALGMSIMDSWPIS